jgi:hypothetical protein
MQAAEVSKLKGGIPVDIAKVVQKASQLAKNIRL